jgi:hypothetical protein
MHAVRFSLRSQNPLDHKPGNMRRRVAEFLRLIKSTTAVSAMLGRRDSAVSTWGADCAVIRPRVRRGDRTCRDRRTTSANSYCVKLPINVPAVSDHSLERSRLRADFKATGKRLNYFKVFQQNREIKNSHSNVFLEVSVSILPTFLLTYLPS